MIGPTGHAASGCVVIFDSTGLGPGRRCPVDHPQGGRTWVAATARELGWHGHRQARHEQDDPDKDEEGAGRRDSGDTAA